MRMSEHLPTVSAELKHVVYTAVWTTTHTLKSSKVDNSKTAIQCWNTTSESLTSTSVYTLYIETCASHDWCSLPTSQKVAISWWENSTCHNWNCIGLMWCFNIHNTSHITGLSVLLTRYIKLSAIHQQISSQEMQNINGHKEIKIK